MRLDRQENHRRRIGPAAVVRLNEALSSTGYSYTAGLTHNFYHYPARFSPAIASEAIRLFSEPGQWVLDPFMGGGTSMIEGLTVSRRMIGVDVNALATFVADVRTTPLSETDEAEIRRWAARAAADYGGAEPKAAPRPRIRNLLPAVELFISGALEQAEQLPRQRQRDFARCVLLRLGQWVFDCRDFVSPRRKRLAARLPLLVDEMIDGLRGLVDRCRKAGVTKRAIRSHRILLNRSAVGLDQDLAIQRIQGRPKLVVTSPPYPAVHVLYHRWQHLGRRETPAPYWIAGVPDGHDASFYTGGSRTPTGLSNYFEMITSAYSSVRKVMDPSGLIVQLVGFSDARTQLPLFLSCMEEAGFREVTPASSRRLGRRVPNRRWYAKLQSTTNASGELLLIHELA